MAIAVGLATAMVVTTVLFVVFTTVTVLPSVLDTYSREPSGFITRASGEAPTAMVPTTVFVVVSITVTVPALLLVTYVRLLVVTVAAAPVTVTSPVFVIAAALTGMLTTAGTALVPSDTVTVIAMVSAAVVTPALIRWAVVGVYVKFPVALSNDSVPELGALLTV